MPEISRRQALKGGAKIAGAAIALTVPAVAAAMPALAVSFH